MPDRATRPPPGRGTAARGLPTRDTAARNTFTRDGRSTGRPLAVWAGLVALLLAAGCRTGLRHDPAATKAAAESARPAPRTIPVEFVFVRHDEHDHALRDELWRLVDEQVLDDGLRSRLAANGLRAGVVTARLPPHLAARFLPSGPAVGETLPAALPDNPALVRHTLRLLPGRSSDVLAATGLGELVLLEREEGAVRGTTYREASPLFGLKAWPAADGRVRLRLAPTIKHGPVERTWVGEDGMFRLEAGQRRDLLEQLAIEAVVPGGSRLVVGSAGESASTAGDAFFRDRSGGGQRLLAIIPAPLAAPVDPMFAPAAAADGDDGAADDGADDDPRP
jgi:hypothetical protein